MKPKKAHSSTTSGGNLDMSHNSAKYSKIGGSQEDASHDCIHSILFGSINAIMCIPVMISFTSIIFRDDAFRQVLPSLIKIVLFSCMVHQISFTVFSGLKFAVGQVQDAGLIFLSAMASSIVGGCKSPESIIPTTLVVLSIYTACLGAMLILLGKLKLASVVQYLPLPVIGGYLAYIGFFCGQAGIAMMAGVEINSPADWDRLLDRKRLLLILPGVTVGILQYVILRTVKSAFTLPICMGAVLTAFYTTVYIAGASLEDARSYGWIAQLSPEVPFYNAWGEFRFDLVDFSLLLPQFPKFFGMVLVVAFSSSLDVAAIEMELGLPLDYNRELQTVGISNLLSGLTGGYTGSYIFSQTLFSLRRGVKSRVAGAAMAAVELLVLALPVSVASYLPKMFFGSMLVLISVDLMWEWLVMASAKMMAAEYAVCVATFMAVMAMGIEAGMAVGVLLSMVSFVVVYAKLPALTSSTLQLRSSSVVRSYEERCTLLCRANRGKIVTISLKGYVFFGSAVKILEEVKSRVILTPAAADDLTSLALTSKSKAQSQSQQKSHNGNFNFNLDQSDERYGKGANMSEGRYENRDVGRGSGIYNDNHMETDIEADVDLDLVAPAPMFSFQMSSVTSKDKIDDKSATGDKRSRGQGQRQGNMTALLLPSSIIPLVFGWKDDSHSDSRSDGSYVGGASPHYISSKSHVSNSSYREEGDEGSWIDEEGCATPREKSSSTSSSGKRGGRKDSHAYEGTAPSDLERERESAAGKGRKLSGYSGILLKESTEGTERVDSLVMGSPLQSLSAYDMNEDMLCSYQKRWMQERTQHGIPTPHAIQTISPSVSTHSLSQSRSQSQSRQEIPSSRPPPHPHPDWTAAIRTPEGFVKMKQKLKASTAMKIEMEVEDEMSITADQPSCSPRGKGVPDTYRDLLPYPRYIATPSASTAAPLDARKQSALSFRIAQLGGIVGIGDKRCVEKEVTDGGGGGAAAPLNSNSRTKSMSNLNYAVCNFSDSSSSSSSSSILGAVWSNQERRRERVKLLSRSRSTPTATERGTDRETERDWEKRSKSYDSLSVAVSRHVGGPHSNNALSSIERNIFSWASSAPSTSESLPPDHTRGTDKGTGTGQGTEMEPTEFLILDFTEVLGIDATSARSCFLMLVQLMRSSGVTVVFAAMSSGMEGLLTSHGVIRKTRGDAADEDIVISTADAALEWCEDQILARGRRDSLARTASPRRTKTHSQRKTRGADMDKHAAGEEVPSLSGLRRILKAHLEIEEQEEAEEEEEDGEGDEVLGEISDNDNDDVAGVTANQHRLSPHSLLDSQSLGEYFKRQEAMEGELVFDVGQRTNKVYFIESGCVEILIAADAGAESVKPKPPQRVNKISTGGIFGEAAFFLDLPSSVRCVALTEQCVLWTLDRDSYLRMEISHPSLCLLVQHTLLKSLSISSTSSLHALHPSTAYGIMYE